VPRAPQLQRPADVRCPVAIVGGSSNGPLMSDGPSLLWVLVAPVRVPHAPW
jgi:hypothetical protein